MGSLGKTLTRTRLSRSVLTTDRPSGDTASDVIILQKWPSNSVGTETPATVPAAAEAPVAAGSAAAAPAAVASSVAAGGLPAAAAAAAGVAAAAAGASVGATKTSPNLSAKSAKRPSGVNVAALTFFGTRL